MTIKEAFADVCEVKYSNSEEGVLVMLKTPVGKLKDVLIRLAGLVVDWFWIVITTLQSTFLRWGSALRAQAFKMY